jgi:hypothetical protein
MIMDKLTSKAAVLEYFKNKIATDDNWALRALIVVYDNQTAFEKAAEHTINSNDVGFSKPDAKKYSYYGRLAKNKVQLYPNVMAQIRRKMPHYANQLVNQCIENGSVRKINGEYVWDNKR